MQSTREEDENRLANCGHWALTGAGQEERGTI